MSTKNLKEKLIRHCQNTCSAIKAGSAISRYKLGQQIHIQITVGMFGKLKLVCDKNQIIGVRGFRENTGDAFEIPQKNWDKAWNCVPLRFRDQLTEFLSRPGNDIEVKCVYKVYYKGIAVASMYDQGLTGKGEAFPDSLRSNRFSDSSKAQRAALQFGKYITGLSEKKGNHNFHTN